MADKRPRPLVAIGSDVQLDVTAWLIDVKDAATALLARMQEIEASPAYQGVWATAHVHGAIYNGPTWEAERNRLDTLLASRPHTKETTRG